MVNNSLNLPTLQHPSSDGQQHKQTCLPSSHLLESPGSSSPSPSSSLIHHQSPSAIQLLPIPLDPYLTSINHHLIPSDFKHPTPTFPVNPSRNTSTPAHDQLPRIPKSKLIYSNQLNHSAQRALSAIWETVASAKTCSPPRLKISRNLDCLFGELHASAVQFKPDTLALIWPQSITNKSLKASFNTQRSSFYFSIRRANIALVAEYILYAMPGEEAYGKNDIVFACEGFLPLVLDPELVIEPESWKLFNELKIQIYIQRLDQSGADEANSRVLPNLFVESLSSYSGLQVPLESEIEFEKLASETKQELITAGADLELLRTKHPYNEFATSALEFLHRCAERVDQQEQICSQLETSKPASLNSQLVQTTHHSDKRKRPRRYEQAISPSSLIHPHPNPDSSSHHLEEIQVNVSNSVDISVDQAEEEEYGLENELEPKGRYNPYRLGRGKGPTSAPRRRWTQQEYDLLLDEVRLHSNKYDCMAQIIKRHGKNGELSEILKDQNNVSLKDKARNLTMEWQRHGYPEDKPWLKEAFARFSVKNFKRSPNNNMSSTAENKEDDSQMMMNIEIVEDGRDLGGHHDHDVNLGLVSDQNSYNDDDFLSLNLNHASCSEERSDRISTGAIGGETRVEIDENLPVIERYESRTIFEDQNLGGEPSNMNATARAPQPDSLGRDDNWDMLRIDGNYDQGGTNSGEARRENDGDENGMNNNEDKGVNNEDERTGNTKIQELNQRTNLDQSYSHSIQVDQVIDVPIEFEIHPNLINSSIEFSVPCLSDNPAQKSAHASSTSSVVLKVSGLLSNNHHHPGLLENHLGNSDPLDQLLDPDLLS